MNYKMKIGLTIVLAFVSYLVQADEIVLKKINSSKSYSVSNPIILSDKNLEGKEYKTSSIINTEIKFPTSDEYKNLLDLIDKQINLPASTNDFEIQFLSFQVISDKYCKSKMKISSNTELIVYVDGEKKTEKLTTEDSLSNDKSISTELTLLPNLSTFIVLKVLKHKSDKKIDALNVSFTKSDSINLTFAYDGKHRTTVYDNLEGTRITDTKTSPNGKYAIVNYRNVDSKGKAYTFKELINLKTLETATLPNNYDNWMPKSNSIYFVNKIENDRYNLMAYNPETNREIVIAKDIKNEWFTISPDESYLIYLDKQTYKIHEGDFKLLLSPEDKQDSYLTRYSPTIYYLSTGVRESLFFSKESVRLEDVHSNSKQLLLSMSEEDITHRPFFKKTVYTLDLETRKLDTIINKQAFIGSLQYSPNGNQLLVLGGPEAFDGIGENINSEQIANSYDTQAFLFNLDDRKAIPITKYFNPAIKNATWDKTSNLIYFNTINGDQEDVFTYDLRSEAFNKLSLSEQLISKFNIAESVSDAVYFGKSNSNGTRAYAYNLNTKQSKLISDPLKPMFDELILGKVEDYNFISSKGDTIYGFYHLPPDFDASKKYPLIVYYYGGTTPTSKTFEHPYSMHNFAALGYVVYTINPSGAIGYGQEFSARHVNAWGKQTSDEIIEGVKKFSSEHSYVDKDNIGCLGASYGGFMTMYLLTQTDIFKAAISHAGISALSSYWGEGYWGYTYSSGASANSYPWNNKELYVEQSPLFNANKINTALLLTHGTVDTNVPIGESIQMYTALKILGKPVEFLQVRGENHGIMEFNKRIKWSHSMYAWFEKWLRNDSTWWNNLYPKNVISENK